MKQWPPEIPFHQRRIEPLRDGLLYVPVVCSIYRVADNDRYRGDCCFCRDRCARAADWVLVDIA